MSRLNSKKSDIATVLSGLVFVITVMLGNAAQAAHWELVDTFSVHDDPKYPASWTLSEDLYSINVVFKRRYKSDKCIGNYSVRFGFSRQFGQLLEDEPFQVEAVKLGGRTPCGHKWTKARVRGSSVPPKGLAGLPASLEPNGNIEVTNYEGDWNNSGAILLYDGAPSAMLVDLLPQRVKDTRYTTMLVRAGDNILYLLYRYVGGGNPPPIVQKSTFGDIHWRAGYYGNTTKTISIDERLPGPNGTSIVRGRWGRTNSSDSGYFEFQYTDSCTFTGSYWRGNGARKKWKGWCG